MLNIFSSLIFRLSQIKNEKGEEEGVEETNVWMLSRNHKDGSEIISKKSLNKV